MVTKQNTSQIQSYDIAIVGAGLVGTYAALHLAKSGFRIALIEKAPRDIYLNLKADGRTTAVALGSMKGFEDLGIAQKIIDHAQRIDEIKTFEYDSPWSLNFDHKEVGDEPLGYIAENFYIRDALNDGLDLDCYQKNIDTFFETDIQNIKKNTADIHIQLNEITLSTKLLVSADGKHSNTRTHANIPKLTFEYDQKAFVAHVTHEKEHNNTAFEIFTKAGPLAFLPMKNSSENKPQSGIVWCDKLDTDWLSIPKKQLESKINKLFSGLGKIEFQQNKMWQYPLSALVLDTNIADRQVIIGDAAHTVHPIAGQGVNLGWRDVHDLVKILQDSRNVGLDIGSQHTLKQYNEARTVDQKSVLAVTDGIHRLFKIDSKIVSGIRTFGLGVVNQIGPLKRFFMKRAMGI